MARELQRLQTRHQKIAELFLGGHTITDIAGELGMTVNSVSRIAQSPLFQSHVARRRRELLRIADQTASDDIAAAKRALAKASSSAVEALRGLMSTGSDAVKLKSATELLTRAFDLKGVDAKKAPVVMSQINIQVLLKALKESQEGEAEVMKEGKVMEEEPSEEPSPEAVPCQ